MRRSKMKKKNQKTYFQNNIKMHSLPAVTSDTPDCTFIFESEKKYKTKAAF